MRPSLAMKGAPLAMKVASDEGRFNAPRQSAQSDGVMSAAIPGLHPGFPATLSDARPTHRAAPRCGEQPESTAESMCPARRGLQATRPSSSMPVHARDWHVAIPGLDPARPFKPRVRPARRPWEVSKPKSRYQSARLGNNGSVTVRPKRRRIRPTRH